MYFTEEDVKSLIHNIETTFSHWYLMFNTIPKWLFNDVSSAI